MNRSAFSRERSVHLVSNRVLHVVSWYDRMAETWCAIAPGYSHLAIGRARAAPPCSSTRDQAIDGVVDQFWRYFESGIRRDLANGRREEGTQDAMRQSARSSKRVYVGELPTSVTEGELYSMFSRHGTVSKVELVLNQDAVAVGIFAFVEMELPSDARDAVRALNGIRMRGNALVVKHT